MKVNNDKIIDLSDSWFNGNRSHVRQAVKRINKVEFLLLCVEIQGMRHHTDLEQIAQQLTK